MAGVTYKYDLLGKAVVSSCDLYPTETSKTEHEYLLALNNKYELFNNRQLGRWFVVVPKDKINAVWDKVKLAVKNGDLWRSKVTTSDLTKPAESHVLTFDTKDHTDLDDVICVLDYLEKSELKPLNTTIKYKVYEQLRTDIYRGGGQRAWMYSSDTIRPMVLTQTAREIYGISEFDVRQKKTVVDCDLCPTEISQFDLVWLGAQNNKYADHCVDSERIGKWMFSSPKDFVDVTWNKIKMAVADGKLWAACVSTTDPIGSEEAHAVTIYTKDYTDISDVISVLDFLEISGIKQPNVISTYRTHQLKEKDIWDRSWLYSSFTIRSLGSKNLRDDSLDTYKFDIHKNEVVADCNWYPSETSKFAHKWLVAVNNKHLDESIDNDKQGKWVLDIPKYQVDETWDKIKMAVKNGILWYSKVSTNDPEDPGGKHEIMVFTKDYTEVDDVINVLNYLESSEFESHFDDRIFYETDQQTKACNNSRGREKSWKYYSKMIQSSNLIQDTYEFDVHEGKLVTDCIVYPSEIDFYPAWLYAKNNKYANESIDDDKMGAWILFLRSDSINTAWDNIKTAVKNSDLWSVVVNMWFPDGIFIVEIFTKDCVDLDDVIRVLDLLESSGIKPPNEIITYQENFSTNSNLITGRRERSWMYSSFSIRSKDSTQLLGDLYEYDIHGKKPVKECFLYPTETRKSDHEWLRARNNKYTNESIDDEKVGKWVLFLKRGKVDQIWDQIKMGVAIGELWSAKVTTTDPEKPTENCTAFIFTKDFTDQDDITRVLRYLKSSGIFSETINYETNEETIYTSSKLSLRHCFQFDIHGKKLVTDCKLKPSQTSHEEIVWLRVRNNKYPDKSIDEGKIGKWMLFVPRHHIDVVWDEIKAAVTSGDLWSCSVATVDPDISDDIHAIMIYTKDYTDVDDVIHVLDYLERSGLKPRDTIISYKTNQQSNANVYHGGRQRASVYSSCSIRTLRSHNDTYSFDIIKTELVTDCDLRPTEINGYPPWLYANNNKYPDESIELKKVGKWMVFRQKDNVDEAWQQIKLAIASGELWSAKVSTKPRRFYYAIMVYTVDYTDLQDVVGVLDYLERSGIKSPDVIIKYTEEHTKPVNQAGIWVQADPRPWIYLSSTVRDAEAEEVTSSCDSESESDSESD